MAGRGSVVPGSDGTARSHAPAPGPAWERRRARWLGGKEGNTHSCRWWVVTATEAGCCHPWRHQAGSRSAKGGGGAASPIREVQGGAVSPAMKVKVPACLVGLLEDAAKAARVQAV